MTERLDALRGELRRGALTLAVLAALRGEHYGYSLRRQLLDAGLDIEEGTLYPLIRRLETQGLLESRWEAVDGRNRRYYRLSPAGRETLAALRMEWTQLLQVMQRIEGDSA